MPVRNRCHIFTPLIFGGGIPFDAAGSEKIGGWTKSSPRDASGRNLKKSDDGQIRERASARPKVDDRRRSARILCTPRDICASRIFSGRDVGPVLLEPLEEAAIID